MAMMGGVVMQVKNKTWVQPISEEEYNANLHTNIHKLLPYFCKTNFNENVSLLYEICIEGSN